MAWRRWVGGKSFPWHRYPLTFSSRRPCFAHVADKSTVSTIAFSSAVSSSSSLGSSKSYYTLPTLTWKKSFSNPSLKQDEATPQNWSENEYMFQAEKTLESLYDCLAEQGYDKVTGFDVELSQGVLTFQLGNNQTYVLNTQRPNRQLWLSSPVSGPWRFFWSFSEQQWKATRTGKPLRQLLNEELTQLANISIPLEEVL
eukprot:jgi/Galph1/5301/GphlegSOOS_G3984.1